VDILGLLRSGSCCCGGDVVVFESGVSIFFVYKMIKLSIKVSTLLAFHPLVKP
jgi:hypothetical protein